MALKDVGVRLIVEGTGKFKSQMKGVERQIGGIGKAIAKNRKAIGIGMTAIGGSILAVGVGAVKMFADFETGMREVSSLIDLSEDQFKALSQDVRTLSRDLGVDAVASTKALYQAISAGVPEGSALDFLAIATKAAIAGVTDTETAVDGLTTVINAFKIPLEDTQKVADIMFAAVKGGKTTFNELSASMSLVAPIAASLGVRFEDVAGAVATLTKQGTPTSKAMTQMRAALVALTKPTKEMDELLTQLGFASGEAALQSLGFAGAMQALSDAAEGNNRVLAMAFGSVEGLNAALGVTGKNAATAAADLESMERATDDAGAATDAFNEINKSAARQFATIQAQLKDIALTLGEALVPAIKPLVESLGRLLAKFGDMIKANPQLFRTITTLIGGMASLLVVLGPILLALPQIVAASKLVRVGFLALHLKTVAVNAVLRIAIGTSISLNAAFIALAATVAALAAGIGLIVFGLTQLNRNRQIDEATEKFDNLREALEQATQPDNVERLARELAKLYKIQVEQGFRIATAEMDAWADAVLTATDRAGDLRDTLKEMGESQTRTAEIQAKSAEQAIGFTKNEIRVMTELQAIMNAQAAARQAEALAVFNTAAQLRAQNDELARELSLRQAISGQITTLRGFFQAGQLDLRTFIQLAHALTTGVAPAGQTITTRPGLVPAPQSSTGGAGGNTTTINVDATYTNPQDPATIALDLEALMLEANR